MASDSSDARYSANYMHGLTLLSKSIADCSVVMIISIFNTFSHENTKGLHLKHSPFSLLP